jgi:hypothetical protein
VGAVSASCQAVKIIFHSIKSLIRQFLIGALASEGVKINAVTVQNEVDTDHRRIAFMRGQPFSSDSEDRWKSIVEVSGRWASHRPEARRSIGEGHQLSRIGISGDAAIARAASSFYSCGRIQRHVGDRRHSRPARLRPARAGRCFCHRARRHSRRRLQQSTSDHDPTTLNPNGKDGGTMRAQPAARLRTVSGTDYV